MSAGGLVLRTIIIVPVLALLVLTGAMMWPMIDSVHNTVDSDPHVQKNWGDSPGVAIFIASIGFPLIGVVLIIWHLVAPTSEDSRPGGGMLR